MDAGSEKKYDISDVIYECTTKMYDGQRWFDAQRISFPTLCTCMVCHGIKSISGTPKGEKSHRVIDDTELAYKAALIHHGYSMCKWEGNNVANQWHFPKKCECACDHKYTSKRLGRCLYEYTCTKCGWTGVIDSSD